MGANFNKNAVQLQDIKDLKFDKRRIQTMWIEYIAEIGMGAFLLIIAIHFAQHFMNRAERNKKRALREQKEQESNQP